MPNQKIMSLAIARAAGKSVGIPAENPGRLTKIDKKTVKSTKDDKKKKAK